MAVPCTLNGEDHVCLTKKETDLLVSFLINQAEYVGLLLECKGAPVVVVPAPKK